MRKINKQEEQVLSMMQHSSSLFPTKDQFHRFDDAAIGWAAKKRKTHAKLETSDSLHFSSVDRESLVKSPTWSQKKAVRLMTKDNEGNVTIEPASPSVS